MKLSAGFARRDGDDAFRRWSCLWIARILIVLTVLAGAGAAAAASYVDAGLPDLKPEDRVVVAHPQPVQLLIQFETKGAPNAAATKEVKPKVIDVVKASGLFSDVGDAPTANGAILSVTINDIANAEDMQNAEAQGFMTGLTFGLAGSTVRDHYICTIDYVSGPNAPKLTRTARHAIIFQLGLIKTAPTNAVKADGIRDAVFTMVRQIVSNPLNDLGRDPAFQPVPTLPAVMAADSVQAPVVSTPAAATAATIASAAPATAPEVPATATQTGAQNEQGPAKP